MTEAAKHTPGPWFHSGGLVYVDSREQVCCGRGITECCGNPDVSGDYAPIAETNLLDAPLIAAAPDLYHALVMVRDADDDRLKDGMPTIPPGPRAVIDRAIAKAEGRTE